MSAVSLCPVNHRHGLPDSSVQVAGSLLTSVYDSFVVRRRAKLINAVVLVGYVLAAAALFGRGALLAPTSHVVGDGGADKTIFIWALRWWPHAIAHGHDPFNANVAWAPQGIDLSWVTAIPFLSVVLWPVTAVIGPVASYDVIVIASPALSAWTAYLLARHLIGATRPAVVAGWFFGFSTYEIGHMVGHLNLVFLPLVPLTVLLAVRHMRGEITSRRFAIWLGLAMSAQFLTSTELYIDLILVAAIFVAAFALMDKESWRRLSKTVLVGMSGLAISLVIVAPYLWHAFVIAGTANTPLRSPYSESADVVNYFMPTHLLWLQLPGSVQLARHFTATGAERGAYLGAPLILLVLLSVWSLRSAHWARATAVGIAAVVVATLGAAIRVEGHTLVPGPWKILAALPVTRAILPIRLTLFVALAASLLASAWLAKSTGRASILGWVVAGAAILFLLPNPASARWTSAVPNPAFFRTRAFERQVGPDQTILVLPYGAAGWSSYWQAEDGFRYRLVGGHFGRTVTPAERQWADVYRAFGSGPMLKNGPKRLRAFLSAHHVAVIVVAAGTKFRARELIASLELKPIHAGDVLVYRRRTVQRR
jgi:hypothetical protein